MKYIRVADAEKYLPKGWDEQPSISATGSVRGMIKLYGWQPGHAFKIGSYIYHFKGEAYYIAQRHARGCVR